MSPRTRKTLLTFGSTFAGLASSVFLLPMFPCSRSTGSGEGQAGRRGDKDEETGFTQLGSPNQ